MIERPGLVTVKGNPLTLLGQDPALSVKAPIFSAVDNDLNSKTLSDFQGKVVIVVSVPSLDTPICDLETRRFNQEAAKLGQDVAILTLSMDLPFAQKRWCGAAGVDRVITLSDHREAAFGLGYGVLIKELRLLARAIFVIDQKGILRYKQLVPELSQEPDYDSVLKTVKAI